MCNRRVFVDTSFFNQAHTWVEILLIEISRFSTYVRWLKMYHATGKLSCHRKYIRSSKRGNTVTSLFIYLLQNETIDRGRH
jgi:hypothetical protein